jgi:multiple sugar transport system permease protein
VTSIALPGRRRHAPRRRRRRRSTRGLLARIPVYAILLVLAVVFVAPTVWGFIASLRPLSAGIGGPIVTHPLHWHNYVRAWHYPRAYFPHYLKNTVFLTALATIPIVLTSALAGFGFARHRARGRNVLFLIMIATTFIPFAVTFLMTYFLFLQIHLINTYWPWLLWGLSGNAGMIFLFRQFYLNFPTELDDAASIDGCGRLRTFIQVYLPNSTSILAVAGVIMGIGWWGDYIWAQLLLNTGQTTLGPKIGFGYYEPPGAQSNFLSTPETLAAALMYTIPPLVFFFLLQKKLARGIVTTGVKG